MMSFPQGAHCGVICCERAEGLCLYRDQLDINFEPEWGDIS